MSELIVASSLTLLLLFIGWSSPGAIALVLVPASWTRSGSLSLLLWLVHLLLHYLPLHHFHLFIIHHFFFLLMPFFIFLVHLLVLSRHLCICNDIHYWLFLSIAFLNFIQVIWVLAISWRAILIKVHRVIVFRFIIRDLNLWLFRLLISIWKLLREVNLAFSHPLVVCFNFFFLLFLLSENLL